MRRAILFYFMLFLAGMSAAQTTDPSVITLDRLFVQRDFSSERFGPARWLEDGGYTTVESSATIQNGRDIVRYDPASGARSVMVRAEQLIPPGTSRPLAIHNYTWSPDDSKLLIYTNSRRVWRQNTRGDYWVLDLKNGNLRQLGGDAEPSTLMFAKFDEQSSRVGYVVKHDLYVEDLATGKITRLTNDGSEKLINGTFDWA